MPVFVVGYLRVVCWGINILVLDILDSELASAARVCVLPSQERMRQNSLGWSWERGAAHLVEG